MTITPEQIRNTAKSGQQMRADTLLEIADRLEAAEAPKGVEMNEELIKLPCCGYYDASAIKWNSFNGVVQCHNCGQVYSALTQQSQEPERMAPHVYAHLIWQIENEQKFDKSVMLKALSVPQSGVREDVPCTWPKCDCIESLRDGRSCKAAVEENIDAHNKDWFDTLAKAEALSQQTEPVAWIHEVTDGYEQSHALSFSPDSFPLSGVGGWKSKSHRPLTYADTAPQSGVREGMLRAAEIVRNGRFLHDQAPTKIFADEAAAAITRAADQVNAASQPDTVAVPMEVIKFLCGESSLDGVEFGDDHPKFPGKYWWRAMLRAAQEGKK